MCFLVRRDGFADRLAMVMPRWLVPAIFAARVEQDYSSFVVVHLFKVAD